MHPAGQTKHIRVEMSSLISICQCVRKLGEVNVDRDVPYGHVARLGVLDDAQEYRLSREKVAEQSRWTVRHAETLRLWQLDTLDVRVRVAKVAIRVGRKGDVQAVQSVVQVRIHKTIQPSRPVAEQKALSVAVHVWLHCGGIKQAGHVATDWVQGIQEHAQHGMLNRHNHAAHTWGFHGHFGEHPARVELERNVLRCGLSYPSVAYDQLQEVPALVVHQ